jgi:hypothetical protein
MTFFYFAYLLEVYKTQDLTSKIWQTLGDALKQGLLNTDELEK